MRHNSPDHRLGFSGRAIALARLALLLVAAACTAHAGDQPRISIIIDDMGDRWSAGVAAIALPGPVAYAFLPHSSHGADLAERAFKGNKEVLLHVPMQAVSGRPPGPGGITSSMNRIELIRAVNAGLRSVPYVSGLSNHMGSKITAEQKPMGWLMDLLGVRGNLYFVDSRTTRHSKALDAARAAGIPSTWRDVFLDNERRATSIGAEFERLLGIAKRRGTALAIGHPHPETIAFLSTMIPRLGARGVRLVPVARLIQTRGDEPPPFRIPSTYIGRNPGAPGARADTGAFRDSLTQSSPSGQAAITR